MAYEITVPRLGWSMEEGTLVRWLKEDGQFVSAGEPLFELESEKATQEIESLDEGILRIPPEAPPPGSIVKVGAVLGYLVADGEPAPFQTAQQAPAATTAPRETARTPQAPASPAIRRLARQLSVEIAEVVGSGAAGRITTADIRAKATQSELQLAPRSASIAGAPVRAIASPRARRVAAELGIDWRRLHGTGRSGRIRERDVRAAVKNKSTPPRQPSPPSVATTSRRRTIAARMLASHHGTAPVTLTTRADATNLVNLRTQFQAAPQPVIPSFTDIVLKLLAAVLPKHPLLAARLEGDQIILADQFDLGLAVDTDEGLLVPVLRDVPGRSLVEIARHSRELIDRARAGKLSAAEMQGGVFTVTNLGAQGIDAFTPIINLPEVAILGLGAVRREAVVLDDKIVPRDRLTLSLTFDHRVVDGAPAARFLQEVARAIENPSGWLLAE